MADALRLLSDEGPTFQRGQIVWTRRLKWNVLRSPAVRHRFGRSAMAYGCPVELEVRRAIRVWCCTGCGALIPKGSLHGSAFYDHRCLECVTPIRPADQWKPLEEPDAAP